MKIFITGEIESNIGEQFRIARKIVLTELNKIQLEIEDV
ncbi:MAG: immunity 44 family protein, partial [Helicobacteraceae bacterium]|nr:immunity 44 family protein [Helicobacteraceae bacterium]MDR2906192.1 immunity 44 family protein [Helicobacteraceae bacterium]